MIYSHVGDIIMAVLVFGSINIDRTFRIPHTLALGETLLSSSLSIQAGGKGANQAVALSKAGIKTYMAGSIGSDGLWIKDQLGEYGVNTSLIKIKDDCYTGTATILLNNEGQNSIVLYGGGNRENDEKYIDNVISFFDKGDWIVLQNEINNLDLIIMKAKKKGMKICLNPSPFEKELLSLPLGEVDLLALNEVEMQQLMGIQISDDIDDYKSKLEELSSKLHSSMLLLTLGEKGSLLKNPAHEDILYAPIVKTAVKDTTAAGDTFLGYFLSSIIDGKSDEEALRRATKASSIAVSRAGAMDSIPFRDELEC